MILARSDSRSLPALPLSLLAAASLVVVSGGALRAQEADADAPATLSYRVATEVNGSPWGEWTIEQGRQVAIARWTGSEGVGEVALVSGPAVGGLPAEPKETGLLSGLLDPAPLGSGWWKPSTYGTGTAVVDSLRLELREGDAPETIAGHRTRHHRLTARLWWRHVSGEGAETPVFETGTADLWFAPNLPFSWLPLAVHPHTPGLAFPLAHGWPEVAWAAIAEQGERLRTLGLLLRARTRDEIRPTNRSDAITQLGEMEYERSVSVSEIEPAAGPPDAGPFADLPRVGRGRAALLEVALFLLKPCGSLESAQGGSFEFSAAGPEREVLGGGSGALLLADAGIEDGYVVVMGDMGETGVECTVVMMPGAAPRPGTFPVSAPNPGFARPASATAGRPGSEPSAMVLHVVADRRGVQRFLALEEGRVRIDEAGPDGVSGALRGQGWVLELDPDHARRLFESMEVELTFQAAPPPDGGPVAPGEARHATRHGAEPGDHEGIEPARVEVAAGAATALAQPPPPGPAIALDGFRRSHDLALPDGIRAVAIGPDGSWTAVSPVSGGRVLLLDLEAGEVAGELTLGGEHDRISSLAVSADGRTLAAGAMGAVHVVGVPGGAVLHRFEVERPGGGAAEVQALAIAPSGQALVATAGPDLVFFDLRTGERIGSRTAGPSGVRRLAWSPDGALLATAGSSPLLDVWSTADLTAMESEEPRCAIDLEHPLTFVGFSSDGMWLVTTDFQANARVWEASTCEPVTAFETGAGFIASFALAPDGGLLITGGNDGTLRAFALASGESRGTLQGDPDSAGVLLSRGGERMLTVSFQNRAITVWEGR